MASQPSTAIARYPIVVQAEPLSEDGAIIVWVASHPELPGCMAQGETPEEAVAELREARELYLDDLFKRGLQVPEPGSSRLARDISTRNTQQWYWAE